MLDSLRRGAGSWVAKLFLLLLVVSFGFWGVADRLRNFGGNVVATVGGHEISGTEFQQAYRNQLDAIGARAGRAITPAEGWRFGLPQRVLSSMIAGAALDQAVAQLGLGLPDKVIAEKIMNNPRFQGLGGKFDERAFQNALREVGLTEQGFVAQEKRNALREQLIGLLEQTAEAPRALLEAMNHYQNEERVVQYFVIPETAAGKIEDPDENALKSYYASHKGEFTAPEYRKVQVLLVTPETYKDNVKVSDESIKAEFEAHKDKYSKPEKREIQQISFPDVAAAEAAKEKLDHGADFMAVARDAGYKENDVNLGLVAKSALIDPKVADIAFSLEKDKVSDPVQGAFATSLIRVSRIVPAANKSLDEVRDSIRASLAVQQAGDEISKLYDKIEDERAAGTSLPEISRKFNIPVFDVVTDRKGRSPDGKEADFRGHGQDLIKPAFETSVGVENAALQTGDRGYAWYELTKITPKRLKPLADVRDEAIKSWREDEIRSQLAKKARELIAQDAKSGEDFAALAKSVNAEVKTTKPLKRGSVEPGLQPSTIEKAFRLKEGGLASAPAADWKGRAVFRVERIVAPKPLDDAAARAMRRRLENQIGGDLVTEYINGLQRSYGVNINEHAFRTAGGGEQPDGGGGQNP
jgi:peptidyl-prolyl cis-trans isomerase D